MITSDNLTSHELIGLRTEIIESSNPQIIGLNGTITDETKSMFTMSTVNGSKMVTKSNNVWKFSINNQDVVLEGSKISKRPHDRIGGRI
ncbi:ribonuclease P, Rpp29 [Candidatus Nitrosarchaeum limnium SFB1]|jgi:ribonuclease P protein subunit POP4|uniref:Ribonuclease P protein component 1 n=1 Tax=Candidatus Nitrosarchaeum limnium SFB1 TaxID=886738 RepID=F3KIX9_9ARCH|nr:ribonuclease P, Rpp29 [Candidatus Nitrosarchaeum limnium SFB1]